MANVSYALYGEVSDIGSEYNSNDPPPNNQTDSLLPGFITATASVTAASRLKRHAPNFSQTPRRSRKRMMHQVPAEESSVDVDEAETASPPELSLGSRIREVSGGAALDLYDDAASIHSKDSTLSGREMALGSMPPENTENAHDQSVQAPAWYDDPFFSRWDDLDL